MRTMEYYSATKREWRTYSNLELEKFVLSEGVTHWFVLPASQNGETPRFAAKQEDGK